MGTKSLYDSDFAEWTAQLENSPSLRRHLLDTLQATYEMAVGDALDETGLIARTAEFDVPKACPWALDVLLEATSQRWGHPASR